MKDGIYRWPVRVYYQDTDAQGVVYHGKYLDFFERARTEILRELNISPSQIHQENGCILMVRRCEIDFRAPGLLEDLLSVTVSCEAMKAASMILKQQVLREDKLLVEGRVEIVCVAETGRPVRVPTNVREALSQYT